MSGRPLVASLSEDARRLLSDPILKSVFVILVIQGIGLGAAFPFTSLWAANVLHLDATHNGVFQMLTGVVGAVFGLTAGTLSDRKLQRRRWILGTLLVGVVGWFGLALAQSFVVGVGFYAMTRVAQWGMLFALVGDWLRHRGTERPAGIQNSIRMGFALGWAAGPSIAGLLIPLVGYSGLFVWTGTLQAFSLAYGFLRLKDAPRTERVERAPAPSRESRDRRADDDAATLRALAPLILFTLAIFLAFAAGPSRFVFLPLFITQHLGAPDSTVGLLFTVAVFCELPLFLVVGRFTDRVGNLPILTLGLVAQVSYFAGLTLAQSFPQILVLEPLFAFTVVATNGIGMHFVQLLMPKRAGLALAIYNLGFQFGPIVGAPLLGLVADNLGWRTAFASSAGLSVVAVLVLVSMRQRLVAPVAEGERA